MQVCDDRVYYTATAQDGMELRGWQPNRPSKLPSNWEYKKSIYLSKDLVPAARTPFVLFRPWG